MRAPEDTRPLSPHILIYRWPVTMAMSILHRITGGALYVGMLLVVWWLAAAASPQSYFAYVNNIYGSIFGQLVLFGFTWALIHHALGGIRHFIWDVGAGFDRSARNFLSWATLAASLVLTVAIWALVLFLR